MVEGGSYPRSRVMDQMIFDRYLMEGLIDLSQHRASEYLLSMATIAGMWATGADLTGVYSKGSKGTVPTRVMPLGNALKKIRKDCGCDCYGMTVAVIVHNYDIRKRDKGMLLFKLSMSYVSNNILAFHKNPLRHFK
jgi:hypothetical protein